MFAQRSFLPCLILAILAVLVVHPQRTAALTENYVALPFRQYYAEHQGMRVLGYAKTGLLKVDNYAVQYFEKGRLEDHSAEVSDPHWAFMYGRLTAELMTRGSASSVNNTNLTYSNLAYLTTQLKPAPVGFAGGVLEVADGVFVPYNSQLAVAPGYMVPRYFWSYINDKSLFPGGWLHDIGLPMTNAVSAATIKDGQRRTIMLQAFERTILTYDPLNPPQWQVERGNIGSDLLLLQSDTAGDAAAKRIEVNLSAQWLYAFEGDEMVYDAPVSTGKDGFETPAGSFRIFAKYEKDTMSGTAGGESWVVPDVPHIMYFAAGGFAMHGTYWHNLFGTGHRLSHGCVNLPLEAAALLYEWAPKGTPVIIYY